MEIKPKGFWTKENCIKEALKYQNGVDFRKLNQGAYAACRKNGWLKDISFLLKIKSVGYWTYENCKNEASNYKTKSEFYKKYSTAYNISRKNGWLEEICSHMTIVGDLYKRCIYALEFSDNSVYIGLSHNSEKRFEEHTEDYTWNKSSVIEHVRKTGIIPILVTLTDYMPVADASKLEEIKLQDYKNNGWIILNKAKCGSVGNNIVKWTKDNCANEALKYNTIKEFSLKCKSAYMVCLDKKWTDEVCSHMLKYNFKTKKYE